MTEDPPEFKLSRGPLAEDSRKRLQAPNSHGIAFCEHVARLETVLGRGGCKLVTVGSGS